MIPLRILYMQSISMYVLMPITNIVLLLGHGMLYKKLVSSVTKMLDRYKVSNKLDEIVTWSKQNDEPNGTIRVMTEHELL